MNPKKKSAGTKKPEKTTAPPQTEGVPKFTCLRCDHIWTPRKVGSPPVRCPRCFSTSWNVPRALPSAKPAIA